MKKVLYVSCSSAPYQAAFFEELGKSCDLTVVYETKKSTRRDETWANIKGDSYKTEYLEGENTKSKVGSLCRLLKYVNGDYDKIIIGCYNTVVESVAILYMRLRRKKFILNIDGEVGNPQNILKRIIRDFILRGADTYLCAGETPVKRIREITRSERIYPYYFSSLSKAEVLKANSKRVEMNETILCIGQYRKYKGTDIFLEVAKKHPHCQFKLVGVGESHECADYIKMNEIRNVEVIPFLTKEELALEYQRCQMLVLPTRKECWGLVINEGAAYGIPIVATYGSGAAVEFLLDKYEKYLAKSGNVDDLAYRIQLVMQATMEEKEEYAKYLRGKAREYTIDKMVEIHLKILNEF